jgi:hypothetical protein
MTESIWIHYARPRPHWYQLGEAEQASRKKDWADIAAVSREAGAVFIGNYHVRGQHDFETVEIWRFPYAEAAFDHWARLTAAAYNEWFAFSNNIGLAMEPTP